MIMDRASVLVTTSSCQSSVKSSWLETNVADVDSLSFSLAVLSARSDRSERGKSTYIAAVLVRRANFERKSRK